MLFRSTKEFLEQELSPSSTNTEDRRVGEGRRAPGMTVQSLKFHPGGVGVEGQTCSHGDLAFCRPGCSRTSSELARVLDTMLLKAVQRTHSSSTGPGPREHGGLTFLPRSSMGFTWAHSIMTPLAGQLATKMF